ncbi:MAG: glycosyltransferase family 2 protein [Bacillota bacterium]
MKVSIVTAVLNNRNHLEQCIRSVIGQDYPDIEYIIIDGGSTDGTVEVIKRYEDKIAYWVSEPDGGIYDAMNKGIKAATGEIIGILNSDDFYADKHVIIDIITAITKNNTDSCYGDILYIDRYNLDKIVRHWKAGGFDREKFKKGWMPPHPTFFCKRSVYEKYGLLNLDFPLAADYELMLRFLYKYQIRAIYIPRILVKMRTKGISKPGLYTLKAIIENYRSWKVNKLYYPITLLLKPFSKIPQFFMRDKK